MNMRHLSAVAGLVLVMAAAHAAPVAYEGVLVSGVTSGGEISGYGWFLDDGANVDYWSFSAQAGDVVTLSVDRLSGNLDPALSLYRGTTAADTSQFNSGGDWGGMTFIGSLDDEKSAFLPPPIPSGDPYGVFSIGATGSYTVVVGGSNSSDGLSYPYRIDLSITPVPEPAMFVLFAAGLIALLPIARRRP